jgi:hypothetical protein
VGEDHAALAVREQIRQLVAPPVPVHRDRHGADQPDAQRDLDVAHVVAQHERDAVAGPDTEPVEPGRDPRGAAAQDVL